MGFQIRKVVGSIERSSGSVKVSQVSVNGTDKVDIRVHTGPREDGSTHTTKGVTLSIAEAKEAIKLLQAAVKVAK